MAVKAIPVEKWRWFGTAAHLIVGHDCRFHLATVIGKYLVSTVGQYLPDLRIREMFAQHRGVVLEGRGDARRADYMRKIGYETIGADRLFETMVFKAGKPCKAKGCACGLPETNGCDLDFAGYNTVGEATAGHIAMCQKWARKS